MQSEHTSNKRARTDGMVAALLRDVPIPRMCSIRQEFDAFRIDDIESAVQEQLRRPGTLDRVRPGTDVAVTAGSRGIANMDRILHSIVSAIRQAGARPFLVPAMGSHGGCTGEGQRKVLRGIRDHRGADRVPDPLEHGYRTYRHDHYRTTGVHRPIAPRRRRESSW